MTMLLVAARPVSTFMRNCCTSKSRSAARDWLWSALPCGRCAATSRQPERERQRERERETERERERSKMAEVEREGICLPQQPNIPQSGVGCCRRRHCYLWSAITVEQ